MVPIEEFVERLCRLGSDRGPRRFPRRRRDRDILTKSILLLLDSGRVYREAEVNEVLRGWKRDVAPAIETDHVALRRLLVDAGHLERTPDGRAYRVGFPPCSALFDLEIDRLDPSATAAAHRESVRARRVTAPRARQTPRGSTRGRGARRRRR